MYGTSEIVLLDSLGALLFIHTELALSEKEGETSTKHIGRAGV